MVRKMSYTAWSHHFVPDAIVDSMTCNLDEREWTRLQDDNPGAKRLFARITVGEKGLICALGNPVRSDLERGAMILPFWALEALGLEGCGENVAVEWLPEESFPDATRIVLRPHDSAFYHADAKDELERALTQYGILEMGRSIPVRITELGGYEISFDVVQTEPANIVLMQGDEVVLEFEGALDGAPIAYEPTVELPSQPSLADFGANMIPTIVIPPVVEGQVLGGTTRERLPDGRAWNPWR